MSPVRSGEYDYVPMLGEPGHVKELRWHVQHCADINKTLYAEIKLLEAKVKQLENELAYASQIRSST